MRAGIPANFSQDHKFGHNPTLKSDFAAGYQYNHLISQHECRLESRLSLVCGADSLSGSGILLIFRPQESAWAALLKITGKRELQGFMIRIFKKILKAISDVSVIRIIVSGFLFLIVIQLAVAVQSYLNIGKFSDSVSMVTTMADPILMSAKSLEARIHTAHSTLNEVLLSQTDKDAQALMSVLNDRRKALKQTMDELENQVKSFELDESGMSKKEKAELTATFTNINLSVAGIRKSADRYLANTGGIAQGHLDLIKKTQKANKLKASYEGLVKVFGDAIIELRQRISYDDYILSVMGHLTAAENKLETRTASALEENSPEKVLEAFEQNKKDLKLFREAQEEMHKEYPDMDNVIGPYIEPFLKDTTMDGGVISIHLDLARELVKAQDQARLSKEAIAQIEKDIKTVEKLAENLRADCISVAHSSMKSTVIQMIIAAVFSIIFVVVVATTVSTLVRVPLHHVVQSISSMTKGDMTGKLNYASKSEFGKLCTDLNKLRLKFSEVLSQMAKTSQRLKGATDANEAITEDTTSAIETQNEKTSSIAQAMEEMTSTVEQIAQYANLTLDVVNKVNDLTDTGSQIIDNNIDATNSLSERLTDASEAVHSVSLMGNDIRNIVNVISEVADQTNLLAINAAIEAARAGQYGRGFAVVADEVRNLAEKTSSATTEVANVIEKLQEKMNNTVKTVKVCLDEIVNTREKSQKAKDSISEISVAVDDITERSHKIVESTSQQKKATDMMAQDIQKVSLISDSNVKAIKNIEKSGKELNTLTEQIDQQVRQFRF